MVPPRLIECESDGPLENSGWCMVGTFNEDEGGFHGTFPILCSLLDTTLALCGHR